MNAKREILSFDLAGMLAGDWSCAEQERASSAALC